MRAMLHGCDIDGPFRCQLWAEAANTATELDRILMKYGVSENSFEKFFGTKAKKIVSQPRVFGEVVIAMDRRGLKSKLQDCGKVCVWVGYAADHAAGTHRVLNPKTGKISLTRDVTFLRQSYGDWKEKKELEQKREVEVPPHSILRNAEEDDFGEERDHQVMNRPTLVRRVSDSDEEDVKPAPSSRLLGELRRLNVSYNLSLIHI